MDAWKGFKPIPKGSYGGGLGHCDECVNPRMTNVHCVKGLKHYCDKHIDQQVYIPPSMSSGAHGATKTSATYPTEESPIYTIYTPLSSEGGI